MLKLDKVEVNIVGEFPDWDVAMSADLTVSVDEHPEFRKRKGIAIELTPEQEAQIKQFVKDVVLPQAEENK